MEDLNFRKGDAKTEVFGSNRMLQPSPVEKIPDGPTTPEIAYQMVKDETFDHRSWACGSEQILRNRICGIFDRRKRKDAAFYRTDQQKCYRLFE